MSDVIKLMEGLKSDLREFYKRKKIKDRVEEIMGLFDPDEEDAKRMPEDLVPLVDSLNDIAEIIYK